MAFETGTATDLDDLFTKLLTFAVANGWTQNEGVSADRPALSKGSTFVQFRYDGTSPAARRSVGVFQALGYINSSTAPGAHTNDSGNGAGGASVTDASIALQRCIVRMGNGPFIGYWFFENNASPSYIHCVVEIATNEFRHFGFGEISKFGNWTGGEYVYGHHLDSGVVATRSTNASVLLDGLYTPSSNTRRAATIRAEGLPGQAAGSRWGQVWASIGVLPNDTAGNAKIAVQGGFRGGPTAQVWGNFNGASDTGLVPMYPITLWYVDLTNSRVYYLGAMADVRGVNIRNFAPKDTIAIGADTWYIFPTSIRTDNTALAENSGYQGIAYKRIDA